MALGPNNADVDPYNVYKTIMGYHNKCLSSLLRVGLVLFNLTALFFSAQNDCDLAMNCIATECFCQIVK